MDVVRVYFVCSNCVFFYCFFGPLPKDDAAGRPLSSVTPSLNPAASRPPRFPPPPPGRITPPKTRRPGGRRVQSGRDPANAGQKIHRFRRPPEENGTPARFYWPGGKSLIIPPGKLGGVFCVRPRSFLSDVY